MLTMPGPEFVAPLYAFLASDDAVGITGRLFRARGNTVEVFPLPEPRPVADRPVAAGPGPTTSWWPGWLRSSVTTRPTGDARAGQLSWGADSGISNRGWRMSSTWMPSGSLK